MSDQQTLLTKEAFKAAKKYVTENGRELDRRLFAFHFEDGPAAAVLAALAPYQNDDGGFGHALEPDLRTAASSAIATSQAFDILREINASARKPIVQKAVAYLLDTLDTERMVWPIAPPEVEDAPHAPWWTYDDLAGNFGNFEVNPYAALVGHLQSFAKLVQKDFLDRLTAVAMTRLAEAAAEMGMFDFFCYMSLARADNLAPAAKEQIRVVLLTAARRLVVTDPQKWQEYGLLPLDIAPAPDALLAAAVEPEIVQTNLDYLIEEQLPDGSWPIPWSWDFIDADAWSQAERDWKGHHTVAHLRVLRAYGRIAV